MKKILAGFLFSMAALLAHADNNYQVEIIVFARDSGDGEDSLRSSSALRYPARTVALTAADGSGLPFQLVPAANLLLNREAGAIDQRKNMHVLLHQGWLWNGEDSAHASAVLIDGGRQVGNHHELEGYIALSAEHFLKIDTQLWLSRFGSPSATTGNMSLPPVPNANSLTAPNGESDNSSDNASVNQLFLLREQRRMRSGELHYFDHSRLGLLVQVTPLTATSSATNP